MRWTLLTVAAVGLAVGLAGGCGDSEAKMREERYRKAAEVLKLQEDVLQAMEVQREAIKTVMQYSSDEKEIDKYVKESAELSLEIAKQKEAIKKTKIECESIAAGS